MRRALLLLSLLFCFSAVAASQSDSKAQAKKSVAATPASLAALQAARASFAKLPLSFEENQGQTDKSVKYLSRSSNYNLFLTADTAVLTLRKSNAGAGGPNASKESPEDAALWLKLLGANADATITASDPLAGKINYYIGNDPGKWRTGVRQYGRVSYQGIYPGVDLTYYGNQSQLESDYVVAPGANPRSIEFEVQGTEETRLDPQGNLVMATSGGDVRLLRPVVYQTVRGVRRDVSGRYVLRGKNRVGFDLGRYDKSNALVIDPIMIYSTFLGGISSDFGNAIAIDAAGAAYVTGQGGSSNFPGSALNGPVLPSYPFVFVTKFNPDGNTLAYSTILRGSTGYKDSGNGIGVDGSNRAYVTGVTTDADFPVMNPFQATSGNGVTEFQSTGFVSGLNADGTLSYSTYFGGRNILDVTVLQGLFADSAGDAYVVGNTDSPNFPTVNPIQGALNVAFAGETNVVVAEFNPHGQPVFSTYWGGNNSDVGNAVVADNAGNVYFTGQTTSTNFPVQTSPAPFQATLSGPSSSSPDVFVTKLHFDTPSSTLTKVSSTYLGGSLADEAWGIAIDGANPPNVYVTGQTASGGVSSTNLFPTAGPQISAFAGTLDAFVTKLKPDFSGLVFSTFLAAASSANSTTGFGIAVDGASPPDVFVTGTTSTIIFPLVNPLQLGGLPGTYAFVSEINGGTTTLNYSTLLGGLLGASARAIAADSTGNAYVTGATSSPNFPVLSSSGVGAQPFQGKFGPSSTSLSNAFVAKISPATPPAALYFFPPVYNFHNVALGTATPGVGGFSTEYMTLTNNTASSVTINSFSFSGANTGDFTIQSASAPCTTTASFALPAGASCLLLIRFTPMDQDARSATLNINSTPSSSTVLNLTGFGAVPEVNLSSNSLTFGTNDPLNVGVLNLVQITNTGGAVLNVGSVQFTGANASAFTLTLNNCATVSPNQSCVIEVTFTPTAGQAYTANLLINDNAVGSQQTVTLSGTGVPQVVVSPTIYEYGGWILGTASPDRSFHLTNGSAGSITLTSVVPGGTNPTDFPIDSSDSTCTIGLVLPVGTSCYLDVAFKPGVSDPTDVIDGRTATLTFNWTGALPGSQTVSLMGAAETGVTLYQNTFTVPASEYVGVTEGPTGFDILYNGTSNAITVTSVVMSGANPGDFAVTLNTNSCSTAPSIPANSSCVLLGSFTPSAVGVRTATATINYTGTGVPPGSSVSVAVTGTGIPGPVQFQPAAAAFGSQIMGLLSPTLRVYLQNIEKTSIQISSITPPGLADFAIAGTSTCTGGTTVLGGGSCYFDLTFTPGALGSRTSSIIVTDSGPGSPRTLNLSGTGVTGVDQVSVIPNVVDFGLVPLVVPPATQAPVTASFYLINGGSTPTTITATTAAPNNPTLPTNSVFKIVTGSGTTCQPPTPTTTSTVVTVLPQGAMCAVAITFTPTSVGEQSDTVTLTDSIGGAHIVTIQGAGVDQGVASMSSVAFYQLPGTTSGSPQLATLTNTGSGPLTITSFNLSETSNPYFSIAPSPATTCTLGEAIPAAPGPGNTCVIALNFTAPAATGSYSASIVVSANVGNGVAGTGNGSISGTVVNGGFMVSPTPPLNFGTVAKGTTIDYASAFNNSSYVSITNTNTGTITFTGIAPQTGTDYAVTNNSCTGTLTVNNTCSFDVTFTPTINGAEPANNIQIAYTGASGSPYSIPVTGTGSNVVVATPNPLNMSTPAGNNSFATLTVGNGSTSTVTISSVSTITPAVTPFLFGGNGCFPTLALAAAGSAGSSCQMSIFFDPTTPGSYTAQFTVNYTISGVTGTQTLTVNLSGTGTSAAVTVNPNPVIFPSQMVNTQSQPMNIVVTNTGTAPLNFTGSPIIGGTNSNDFALAALNFSGPNIACEFSFNIAPGLSCTVTVNFTPNPLVTSSARNATLTITDNAYPNKTQVIPLQGTAGAGTVSTSTTSLTFPQTNVGSSVTQGVTFSNSLSAAVTFTSVAYTGPYSSDTGPNSCVTGQSIGAFTGSCVIYIKFSPTGGTTSGTGIVTYNGTSTLPTINLSGPPPNPVPVVTGFSPAGATAGGTAFTLTVNGSGFVNGATVNFNGSARSTTFISTTQLTASISPADVASAGWDQITVFNPGPGGGLSNAVIFPVLSGSTSPTTGAALRYVPVTPCRVLDTRNATGPFGGPSITGGTSRSFTIPSSACGIPSTAAAYSVNMAVVPAGPLGYLTVWPTGQTQPLVATVSSVDGRVRTNAAIVPAGTGGAISMFASNTTDVVLDINGYFTTASTALQFYPVTPCRVVDTRNASGPLGGPTLAGGTSRTFPLAGNCNLPGSAQAYSLNLSAVPQGPLGYLTAWPTGQTQPGTANVSAVTGTVTSSAAIVPAGTSGSIDVFASNTTDLVIDVNGYFAPAGAGGLSLYNLPPCRVLDTRNPSNGPAGSGQAFSGELDEDIQASGCGVPVGAQAYVFNTTVVPPAALGYLSMWPQGTTQPLVATLSALDASVTSNLAIVPTANGAISTFGSNSTQLIMDLFGYFAP